MIDLKNVLSTKDDLLEILADSVVNGLGSGSVTFATKFLAVVVSKVREYDKDTRVEFEKDVKELVNNWQIAVKQEVKDSAE